jgi:single-stranded DNA-binding protein
MQLLGGRDGDDDHPAQRQQQPRQQSPQRRPAQQSTGTGFDDMDDDIPF